MTKGSGKLDQAAPVHTARVDEDKPFIYRTRNGDYEAFEWLVRKYQARVYHHGLKFLNSREDAEDILQETFLQAYRALGSFRGDSSFSTWLMKIATNNCLMKLRKKKKMDTISIDKPIEFDGSELPREIVDWSMNPSVMYGNEEIREAINRLIAKLPEDKRVVLILKDVEGFSNIEISEMLDMTVAAVKSRLHRARLFMRAALSRHFEDAPMIAKKGSEK